MIRNPLTGRLVSIHGQTYKKTIKAVIQDPDILFKWIEKEKDMSSFVENMLIIFEQSETKSGTQSKTLTNLVYDPQKYKYLFFIEEKEDRFTVKYEHIENRHLRGFVEIKEKGKGKGKEKEKREGKKIKQHPLFDCSLNLIGSKAVNECFLSSLDSLDSWSELEAWRYIETDDHYGFDLYFLIKLIVNQLNEIKSGNPFPIRPTNPFTGLHFTFRFLESFRERMEINRIEPSLVLQCYLNKRNMPADDAVVNQYDLVAMFEGHREGHLEGRESKLRYVRDFGQGHWDSVDTPPSFEEIYILPILQLNPLEAVIDQVTYYGEQEILPDRYYFSHV
jgi:hypothetical protein